MATQNLDKAAVSLKFLNARTQAIDWLAIRKVRMGLCLLLILLGAGYLYVMTVNTPLWDEWELVPIFQHLHAGHFYWHDFWQEHNGHRLLLPVFALVGMAYLTHWNIRIECLVGLLIAVGSFLLIRNLVLREPGLKNKSWLVLVLALVWFSPVQAENWLWGWQIEWFMNVAGVVILAYGAARLVAKGMTRNTLLLLLVGALLSQYSLGNGTLLWPILFVVLLYLRLPIKQLVIPFAVGIFSSALYYVHYTKPSGPSRVLIEHHPVGYAAYVLGYLGRPLSYLGKPAIAFGLLLSLLFLGLGLYLFLKQQKAFRRALPWLILGFYSMGSALLAGLARFNLGVNEAFSSRYTTISMLLLVSVIALCYQHASIFRDLLRGNYKAVALFAVVGIVCLVLLEYGWGIHSIAEQHAHLVNVYRCTSTATPSSQCLATTYPDPSKVAPRLQFIKSIHWSGY